MKILVRALTALGALSAILALVILIVVGPALTRGLSTREKPSGIETLSARALRRFAMPSQQKELRNPLTATTEVLASARAHWADHCAGCHANNGSGATEIGRNLYPPAPDMRLAVTQELSDGALYSTIKNGVRLTGMPAWGKPGDDDRETWALVTFIRHLPKLSAEEEKQMQGMNPVSPHERDEDQEEQRFLNGE